MRTTLPALIVAAMLLGSCARPTPSLVPLSVGTDARTEGTASRRSDRPAPRGAEEGLPAEEAAEASASTDGEKPHEDAKPEDEAEPKAPADEKSEEGESKAALVRWDGDYTGEDVATYRFGGTERVEKDPKAKTRVHDQTADSVKLTLVNSANGSDLCTLTGKLKGNSATLEAGQDCFSTSEGPVSARGTLQSGSATLKDDVLTLEATLSYQVTAEGQVQTGELSYRFEGRKNKR